MVIVLYVDDMLLTGPNEKHIADFKVELNSTFEMSDLGPLHHYLGIQFWQNDDGIALLQTKYIESLLHCFDLEDCRPIATPMETGLHLNVYDAREYFDAIFYQQAVECIIYVGITRPDIQYVGSQVTRFMHSLGTRH